MPKKTYLIAALVFWLCFPAALMAADDFKLDVNYSKLAAPRLLLEPDGRRLEITMFFWYGCGACALMDPVFSAWAETLPEDVAVRKLPTTYAGPWNMHARVFMALEEMGLEKKLHEKIFETFKTPEGMARTEDDLPGFAGKMGLDADIFMKTYESPAVTRRMERLDEIMKAYDPQVVPSIVVDGRYLTDLGRVENPAELIKLSGQLLEKARTERAAGK